MIHAADPMPIATAVSADLLAVLTLAAMLLAAALAATMLLMAAAGLRLGRHGVAGPTSPPERPAADPWREAARRLLASAAPARR